MSKSNQSDSAVRDGLVLVAEVGAPVGLRGEVRVNVYTETAATLMALSPFQDDGGRRFDLSSIRPHKNASVARFKSISTREAAQALTHTRLYVERARLPQDTEPDEFYLVDLIGCDVVDLLGAVVGKVLYVHNFGAGDVIEYGWQDSGGELVAFTGDNFPKIDIAGRQITISPPDSVAAEPAEDKV